MPLYVYRDKATGKLVERIVPVFERDNLPGFERITVPQRIGFVSGITDPEEPERAVPRALRDLEMKQSARSIAKEAGFSVEQLKRTWLT